MTPVGRRLRTTTDEKRSSTRTRSSDPDAVAPISTASSAYRPGSSMRGTPPLLCLHHKLRVDVWADVAWPVVLPGEGRLEAAIARMPSPGEVEVVWRLFGSTWKLRASAEQDVLRRAAREEVPRVPEQANAMIQRMTSVAAADGLSLHLDRVRPGNTFDAHRVLHLARERGVQRERLADARLLHRGRGARRSEGAARLSGEAGLDPDEVRRALAGDAYADGCAPTSRRRGSWASTRSRSSASPACTASPERSPSRSCTVRLCAGGDAGAGDPEGAA